MTVYADQTFYTEQYLQGRSAKISDADFPYFAMQASAQINRFLGGAVLGDAIPEEVRLCCCEVAELLYTGETSEASKKAGLASESVQGWSQSYESSESRSSAQNNAIDAVLHKWLDGLHMQSTSRIDPDRRWRQCW